MVFSHKIQFCDLSTVEINQHGVNLSLFRYQQWMFFRTGEVIHGRFTGLLLRKARKQNFTIKVLSWFLPLRL